MKYALYLMLAAALVLYGLAQQTAAPVAETQNNTFGVPSGSAPDEQAESLIQQAGLSAEDGAQVQVVLDYEKTNWATGSVTQDPFYQLPGNASQALPGALLKVEDYTNVTKYTVPPDVALSRFLYQSKDFNGTAVPASGYVLWPWLPRRFDNVTGAPVVLFAHGTSGFSAECAPSHLQNLWFQFYAPFTLATMGYAVVAPDYAGLGVSRNASMAPIQSQWAANPAQANDMFYAFEAARDAWPSELSEQFVVMGQSQGGGVSWASAVRQAQEPVDGYLGTIAASPTADWSHLLTEKASQLARDFTALVPTIKSIFPEFEASNWLTDEGLKLNNLFANLGGCQFVRNQLFWRQDLVKPNWNETSWYLSHFNDLITAAGKPVAGPMLLLQGTNDSTVSIEHTDSTFNKTCQAYPDSNILYDKFDGVDHVPVLFASQQIWMDWIGDRFAGRTIETRCKDDLMSPMRPRNNYQKEVNYYMQLQQYSYEV